MSLFRFCNHYQRTTHRCHLQNAARSIIVGSQKSSVRQQGYHLAPARRDQRRMAASWCDFRLPLTRTDDSYERGRLTCHLILTSHWYHVSHHVYRTPFSYSSYIIWRKCNSRYCVVVTQVSPIKPSNSDDTLKTLSPSAISHHGSLWFPLWNPSV